MSKGLDALNRIRVGCLTVWDFENDTNVIEKELKALEIIKNRIDILGINGYLFTREEYDSLKEILAWFPFQFGFSRC